MCFLHDYFVIFEKFENGKKKLKKAARVGMTKKDWEEELRDNKQHCKPEEVLEFYESEEMFSAEAHIFNLGLPYLTLLEHYHHVATGEDTYYSCFLHLDWLKETVKKWGD